MSREIERKFIIKKLPENLDQFQVEKILQGYLKLENDELEIRFRKIGDKYFQTIKKGNGLNREEIELSLTKEQFVSLWPLTKQYRIIKSRYHIPFDNYTIELDIYEGKYKGFIASEVEFPSEKEAKEFNPPKWFGPEVTNEYSLQNNNLALYGFKRKLLKKYNIHIEDENIYLQSGAVPIRRNDNDTEVLIIKSSNKENWIFPKGIIEHHLSSEDSAKKETFEEAGVLGDIGEKIGEYSYEKWNAMCNVELFLFENVIELKKWPEDYRKRKWVKINKLHNYIKKEELLSIVKTLQKMFNK